MDIFDPGWPTLKDTGCGHSEQEERANLLTIGRS